MHRWMYGPVARPGFRFDRAFWDRGREPTSATRPNARHQGFPPEWIWVQRAQWGLWALLVKLGAEGDFASPFRALLTRGGLDAATVHR